MSIQYSQFSRLTLVYYRYQYHNHNHICYAGNEVIQAALYRICHIYYIYQPSDTHALCSNVHANSVIDYNTHAREISLTKSTQQLAASSKTKTSRGSTRGRRMPDMHMCSQLEHREGPASEESTYPSRFTL